MYPILDSLDLAVDDEEIRGLDHGHMLMCSNPGFATRDCPFSHLLAAASESRLPKLRPCLFDT